MEHAINLGTVLEDRDQAERYTAHLDLGLILAEETLPDAFDGWIPGDLIRDMRHRLKVEAREPRERLAFAVTKYGSGFRRSWSSKNLHDRASDQGVVGMYDLYRIASLTAHGSAGATMHSQRTDGLTTSIGIGEDLTQASLGYIMGLFSVFSVDALLERAGIESEWEYLHQVTQPLIDRWGVYWWLTNRYDKNRFRQALEQGPPTILAVSRRGATRWYVDLPNSTHWQRGMPPTLSDDDARLVARIAASLQVHPYFDKEPHAQWIALRMPYTEAPALNLSAKPIPRDAIELLPFAAIANWNKPVDPQLVDQIDAVDAPANDLGVRPAFPLD